MKSVPNPKPTIVPGMKLRLKNGENVPLAGRNSYKWDYFETVDHLEGKVIKFRTYDSVTWYTTDMDWETQL